MRDIMIMGWTRISSLGNTQQLTAGAVGSIVPGPAAMAEFEKMRTEEEEEELPISAGSWAIRGCYIYYKEGPARLMPLPATYSYWEVVRLVTYYRFPHN